jgi:ubiquinone/menaquinone biosynthesis C-methylase UbiE
LQFNFLCEQGLQPHHHLLDVGCGSLRGGVRFISYLEPGHYYGIDKSQELLDAGWGEIDIVNLQARQPTLARLEDFNFQMLGQTFEYALAQSVFTHLPLNSIVRCLVNVDRVLCSGGIFYSTFFENCEGKQNLEPLIQGDGIVSYYDKNPFHYTLDAFVWACEGTMLEVEYIGNWKHPRNQRMLAFRKI